MMDRDKIIDLLAIIAANDNRGVGEVDIVNWQRMIGEFGEGEAIDAIDGHFRECPGVWLEPGHVVARVRAARRDRLARMDPDDRDQAIPSYTPTRRDRFGYIDKSAPDEPDYPADWTPEQRVTAYWDRMQTYRDQREYEDAIARRGPLLRERPASQEARTAAIAAFTRQLSLDDLPPDEDGAPASTVNVKIVKCPYCQAGSGESCTKAGPPGRPRELLTGIPGHPSRIIAAAEAQGYTPEAADVLARELAARHARNVRRTWEPGDAPANLGGLPEQPVQARPAMDVSAERGAQIAASGLYAATDPEPEQDRGVPGGWIGADGKQHFPDSEALDKAWAARSDTVFGG